MRTARLAVSTLFLLVAAAPAAAQQLLANRSFDADLSSWTLVAGAGTDARSTTTFNTSPGALQISNNGTSGNTEVFQCVAVTNGASYNWGAWSFVPNGQEAASNNQVQVYWCNSAACTSCGFSPGGVTSTVTGSWEHLTMSATTAQDNFGKVVLRAHANSTTAYQGFFDDAFLGIGITPTSLSGFSAE